MAATTIRAMGDPILRAVSSEVTEVTPEILSLVNDMIDTMRANNGAGLAAPQVGQSLKIVTINCSELPNGNPHPREDGDNILVLINPALELSPTKVRWREACLSLPGVTGMVERSDHVVVRFLDHDGNEQMIDIGWPLAGAIQHECDHLEGILYLDRMSRLARNMLLKKFDRFKNKVEKTFRERMGLNPDTSQHHRKLTNIKARKSRKQKAKVSRVSRRSNRST